MNARDLLNTLSTYEQKFLIKKNLPKNSLIHAQGDICEVVDLLVSGEIVMSQYDIDGNIQTFNYLKAPSIFGNNLVNATEKKYLGDVIATTKVTIYQISATHLHYLLLNNSDFLNCYLNIIADKSLEISKRLQVIAIQNARRRILSYLKMKMKDNSYHIKSLTSFALEISLPRETVSRLISKLQKEGIITYENHYFSFKKVLESI